jgi:hypothetical protein
MTDRETLEAVAKGYHDLVELQRKQKVTTALMLRACVAQLNSPDSRKRREAITSLTQLADLLDPKEDPK